MSLIFKDFWPNNHADPRLGSFFRIFGSFNAWKMKSGTSRAQTILKNLCQVHWIFINISTKNQPKIRWFATLKGLVMAQTFQCFLLLDWLLQSNLFRGVVRGAPRPRWCAYPTHRLASVRPEHPRLGRPYPVRGRRPGQPSPILSTVGNARYIPRVASSHAKGLGGPSPHHVAPLERIRIG